MMMFSMAGDGRGRTAGSADFLAENRVDGCDDEEGDGEADENEIVHERQNTPPLRIRLIKNPAQTIKKTLRPNEGGYRRGFWGCDALVAFTDGMLEQKVTKRTKIRMLTGRGGSPSRPVL
jgi:hypothetical protein